MISLPIDKTQLLAQRTKSNELRGHTENSVGQVPSKYGVTRVALILVVSQQNPWFASGPPFGPQADPTPSVQSTPYLRRERRNVTVHRYRSSVIFPVTILAHDGDRQRKRGNVSHACQ